MELEVDSDNDNVDHSEIEMTKAEAEALDRGLQVLIYVIDVMLIITAVDCFYSSQLHSYMLLEISLSSPSTFAYLIDQNPLMCYLC